MNITTGTRLYFVGDFANESGACTVTGACSTEYGCSFSVVFDDGRVVHVVPAEVVGEGRRFEVVGSA
jgi:hypothetical protein